MEKRHLGQTGLEVTDIGLGCWAIGGTSFRGGIPTGWTGADIMVSLETVRRAWQAGVNFYDTADAYGRGKSEVLVGLGLYKDKDKAVIATKAGNSLAGPGQDFSEPYLRGTLDGSLTRLERDYVDLFQLHGPSLDAMTDELFDLMRDFKASGKIRAWGVSVNSAEQGLRAIAGGAETIQLVYNILQQDIGRVVFPVARGKKVGIIVREALASGWLTGKFDAATVFSGNDHRSRKYNGRNAQETAQKVERLKFLLDDYDTLAEASLRFVLTEPAVSSVIAGCKTPEQVEANLQATGQVLSAAQMRRIQEALY